MSDGTLDLFDEPSTPRLHEPAALHDLDALFALLDRWVERGWLRSLDRALAVFLHREVNDGAPLLLLAAALASHQLGRGHVCLDVAQTLAAPNLALSLPPEGDDLSDPPPLPSQVLDGLKLETWQTALDHPGLIADGRDNQPGNTPLVRVESASNVRLYLRRYWQYEQDIRQQIGHRLETPSEQAEASGALITALNVLFPSRNNSREPDWQKLACALAARARFAVITGGPGTGKTTTVVKLLALLQSLALEKSPAHVHRPLRIRLAAPTGKAAARLNESIAGQVANLPLDDLMARCGLDQRVTSDDEARRRTTKARSLQVVNEQLEEDFNDASSSAVALGIPQEVTTLHRLLGSRPDTRHFRHHAGNRLALDVLVIDEASMVDIEMMAAVLAALPPRARLILLGDKDQLASVEAGAVLGDLCQRADGGHYTPATCDWLERISGTPIPDDYKDDAGKPLDQAIAMLRVSHRFDAESGIGQLAQAVNRPLSASHQPKDKKRAVRQVFGEGTQQRYADIAHLRLNDIDDPAFDRLVVDGNPADFLNGGRGRTSRNGELPPPTGYRHYLDVLHSQRPGQDDWVEASVDRQKEPFDNWALAVLKAHNRFQLLCALRKGPWGVEGLNQRIAAALKRHGLIDAGDKELDRGWYQGRPVLVTRNDYGLGLMNGDIGITLALPHPQEPNKNVLRVAFPTANTDKPIKWVLPSRLQAVETVFAMTVHKSQGSEFTHTALLLPDAPNPILTRELVYTGVTRAKDWFTLVESGRGILDEAVLREVTRVSGLGIIE
nr:exodeoxyribonuclease V subunit alpha [uncultured Halomonas sp.]